MALTLTDLQYKLTLIDEISLMEILEITSEDLAQRFMDRIETKYDQLITEFEPEGDELSDNEDGWWEFQDTQNELYTDDDYIDEQ